MIKPPSRWDLIQVVKIAIVAIDAEKLGHHQTYRILPQTKKNIWPSGFSLVPKPPSWKSAETRFTWGNGSAASWQFHGMNWCTERAYFDDFVALTSLKVMIMIMMLLMPDLAEVWSDGQALRPSASNDCPWNFASLPMILGNLWILSYDVCMTLHDFANSVDISTTVVPDIIK